MCAVCRSASLPCWPRRLVARGRNHHPEVRATPGQPDGDDAMACSTCIRLRAVGVHVSACCRAASAEWCSRTAERHMCRCGARVRVRRGALQAVPTPVGMLDSHPTCMLHVRFADATGGLTFLAVNTHAPHTCTLSCAGSGFYRIPQRGDCYNNVGRYPPHWWGIGDTNNRTVSYCSAVCASLGISCTGFAVQFGDWQCRVFGNDLPNNGLLGKNKNCASDQPVGQGLLMGLKYCNHSHPKVTDDVLTQVNPHHSFACYPRTSSYRPPPVACSGTRCPCVVSPQEPP